MIYSIFSLQLVHQHVGVSLQHDDDGVQLPGVTGSEPDTGTLLPGDVCIVYHLRHNEHAGVHYQRELLSCADQPRAHQRRL